MGPLIPGRGADIFRSNINRIRQRTDRMFAYLFLAQWCFAVALALWAPPRTRAGSRHHVHLHAWAAVVLGGAISALPSYLALRRSGEKLTRHVVAAGQMLTSALLIHLSGGRIETHFHIFGSLAFLAFYRDWPVLLTASAVVALDHGLRGVLLPQSVYGVLQAQPWRFLEHTAWVLFEDAFLINSIHQGLAEMWENAERQAELEALNKAVERQERAKAIELMYHREAIHRQFLANMSHELRTPIASIKGYAETLRRGGINDRENRLDFIQTIEKNANRLGSLVENLLDLSRINGRTVSIRRTRVELAAFIFGLIRDLKPQARGKELSLRSDVQAGLAAFVDQDHLWQMLQNLVVNAVKFSPRRGAILIKCRADAGRAVISVSDEGPGLPSDQLPLLFERFHQSRRGTSNEGGHGLGLAIVKTLAELNGGTVSAGNQASGGALLVLRLPLASANGSPG